MASADRIGWIGTGKMGAPMARRLADAGERLIVHDLHVNAAAAIGSNDVEVASDSADLASRCDIIFTSLPDDGALETLVLGDAGVAAAMRRGTVLVETSTVSPASSARIAQELARRGVAYVRAPLSGSTSTAAAGKLTVLASGPADAYMRVRPLMEHFAARFFHVGEAEEARTLKLVVNMLVGAMSALVGEALTFGRKGNLSIGQILEVLGDSAVATPLLAYKHDALERGDFAPAFTVRQMMKDFDLILDAARTTGAPVFLTALIRQHYGAADAQGDGQQDFFVLLRQYEALAGLSSLA